MASVGTSLEVCAIYATHHHVDVMVSNSPQDEVLGEGVNTPLYLVPKRERI